MTLPSSTHSPYKTSLENIKTPACSRLTVTCFTEALYDNNEMLSSKPTTLGFTENGLARVVSHWITAEVFEQGLFSAFHNQYIYIHCISTYLWKKFKLSIDVHVCVDVCMALLGNRQKTDTCLGNGLKNDKLRWYPQQPRRFIFTSLSEACCEAKRWKPSAEPIAPDPALHQRFPKPPFPQPSPEPVEPDLALHQSLPNLHRNLHRNPIEPDLDLYQSLPETSPELC